MLHNVERWKKVLLSEKPEPRKLSPQVQANEIIGKIPGLMEEAIKLKWHNACIYKFVSNADVPGTDPDRVDKLGEKRQRGGSGLIPDDFTEKLAIVVRWCNRNGLACIMMRERIPMNDDGWAIYVRPQ